LHRFYQTPAEAFVWIDELEQFPIHMIRELLLRRTARIRGVTARRLAIVPVMLVMVMVVVVVVMPNAPTVAMQFIADLADDVERPFMAMAAPADNRVDKEIGADADRDSPAIGLGLCRSASAERRGKRQRRKCR
jgi:hypothetical protein